MSFVPNLIIIILLPPSSQVIRRLPSSFSSYLLSNVFQILAGGSASPPEVNRTFGLAQVLLLKE
jgi:hypothetical protein